MKKRLKKYTKDCPIPTQPSLVLLGVAETPWEISSRLGLDHHKLCDRLIDWHGRGLIVSGFLSSCGVRIPVFRMRLAWD